MNKLQQQYKTQLERKREYPREDDHIYYNVKLSNTSTITSIPATYLESRSTPIIPNESNRYYCSVVRFKVSASSVPLFIFQTGDYKITITGKDGIDYPTHTDVKVPGTFPGYATPLWIPNQTFPDDVGFVWTPEEWALSVTNAFLAAYNQMPMGVQPTAPPFILYSPSSKRFSLYATNEYNSTFGQSGVASIWLNSGTFSRFEYWNAYFQSVSLAKFANILIQQNGTNQIVANYAGTGLNCTPAINGITYYQIDQQENALYLLTDVDTIVIATSLLPVNPEQFGSPQGISTSSFQTILTDFQPDIASGITERSYYEYSPFVYRWFDIPSDQQIINLDFKIYWKDIRGVLHLIKLYYNRTLDIKLLFQRKSSHVTVDN